MGRKAKRRPFGGGRRTGKRSKHMYTVCANYTNLNRLVRDVRYLVEFDFPFAKKSETDLRYLDDGAAEMRWAAKGASYRAYLSSLDGLHYLALSVYRDGERIHRDVIPLNPKELVRRGILRKEEGYAES